MQKSSTVHHNIVATMHTQVGTNALRHKKRPCVSNDLDFQNCNVCGNSRERTDRSVFLAL